MADIGQLLSALFGAAQRYFPASDEDSPAGTAGMFSPPTAAEISGADNALSDWWQWRNAQGWVPTAEDIANLSPGGMAGTIRAWHGSPHSFDRFLMGKVGTGEGAQAYGHGLYFSGNQKVAEAYREALTPGSGTTPRDAAARWLKQSGGDADAARAAIRQQIERAYESGDMSGAQELQRISGHLYDPESLSGRLYEVQLRPDERQMLDWDMPIGSQPQAIQDAIAASARKISPNATDDWIRNLIGGNASGGKAYKAISGFAGNAETASKALSEHGVPGIRYLDAGSRSAGEGSRNYVIFDEKDVEILKKLGLLAPLFGISAASGQSTDQPPQ